MITRLLLCSLAMIVTPAALLPAAPSQPPVAESSRPIKNVLFLISDDLRASTLGCYGDAVCKTPNIDRLARRGMLFDRAYCQGTWCAPSRTSLMFGRYKGRGPVNLGQHFVQNDYYSARVGKIYHMAVPRHIIAGSDGADLPESWTERFNSPGLEPHTPGDYECLSLDIFTTELEGRQTSGMPHRMFVAVRGEGDGSEQPDYKTATKIIELLRQHRDQPFFLAAGFVRPHYPMVAPRRYFAPYPWEEVKLPCQVEGDLDDIPKLGRARSRSANNGLGNHPDNQKRVWQAYYATVTFMDAQVGRILNELDALGLRDSTAVVFTSDHGYYLGDHTFWQKVGLHEEVARVPLIVAAPGYAPGRTGAIAELVDLFPTLCELTGLERPAHLQGESLAPVLADPTARVREGAVSFARGASWRTEDWAYMRYTDGSEELYDMQNDPGQHTNLAAAAEHDETRTRLAAALTARLEQAGAQRNGK
ncbi:MAG: sulfatase [Planctomycetota bacterium]